MGSQKNIRGRGKRQTVVDIFCHYITKAIGEKAGGSFPRSSAEPDVRLKMMDEYGIEIQAISLPSPYLLGLGAEDAADICRTANNDNYGLCKAFPDRFVNVCAVSLLDVKEALKEVRRGVDELDCRGITIATNQNGKGLDSQEYFPFYEKLVEHDLPLLLHPTNWESYPLVDMEKGWRMMLVFGWPFDTTQAIWRLIFGGVIDRFPSLKIVTHHLGAMLPFFSRRIEQNVTKFLSNKLPRPIDAYWTNFYGDTAVDGTDAACPCGYAFFGPDRMVFASDYPYGHDEGKDFVRENLESVRRMKIPAAEMKKILGENAKKLLKIK